MILSEMVEEIEEYFNHYSAYSFDILEIKKNQDGDSYDFTIEEYLTKPYVLTVHPNGLITNENDDDIIDLSIDAYDDDKEVVAEYKAFRAKWYKEV